MSHNLALLVGKLLAKHSHSLKLQRVQFRQRALNSTLQFKNMQAHMQRPNKALHRKTPSLRYGFSGELGR